MKLFTKKKITILVIAAFLFSGAYFVLGGYGVSGPSAAPNLANDGLVGYWNMEEGTGQTISDRSGNGNTGTLGGTTAVQKTDPVFTSGYSSAGPGGTALQFDGVDDYVNAGNGVSLVSAFDGSYTVEMWIKTTSAATVKDLWNKQSAATGFHTALFNYPTAGKVKFYDGSSIDTNALDSITANLNNGNWRHLVFQLDITTQRIYIDGVLDNSKQKTAMALSVGNLFIGSNNALTRYFSGAIDEVRIYNRALSADEIRQHYNQKKPVLEWKFDEGSGTTVRDESFNNNDGTLHE